jgi:elongation factor Ts
MAAAYPDTGRTVEEQLTHNIATIGENMSFRRVDARCRSPNGVVAELRPQRHVAPGLGKIGVSGRAGIHGRRRTSWTRWASQLAMHVAAARPEALTIEDVDASALDREREVLAEQARASGKPEEIVEKMVQGRLRKYYEEVVLTEQVFVVDGETKVSKVVENAAADVGAPITLTGFARFELGEGIEKKEDDFAAEVAAAVKG